MERALRSNCGDIYKIFLFSVHESILESLKFSKLTFSLSLSRLESPKRSKDKTIQGGARVNSFKNPNVQSAFEGYGIEGTVSLCSYPPGMRTRLDFLISKGRRDSCVDPQLFRSCGSRVPLSLNASSYLVNQQSLSRDNFSLFTTAFILSFSSRKIRASSFVPRRRNVSPSLPQNKSNEERRSRGSKVGKRIRENSIPSKCLFSYSTKFVSREEISILPYCLLPISTLL